MTIGTRIDSRTGHLPPRSSVFAPTEAAVRCEDEHGACGSWRLERLLNARRAIDWPSDASVESRTGILSPPSSLQRQ
jgi:hypothetical protein